MPSFSSDFCASTDQRQQHQQLGRVSFASPPPPPHVATPAPFFAKSTTTTPESAGVLPSRLIFSPEGSAAAANDQRRIVNERTTLTATSQTTKTTSTNNGATSSRLIGSSPIVPQQQQQQPQQNGVCRSSFTSTFEDDHFRVVSTTNQPAFGGPPVFQPAADNLKKSYRKSLDGSFRVIGTSTSFRSAGQRVPSALSASSNVVDDVCNSTPLSDDDDDDEVGGGENDGRFALRCSNIASPILRSSQTSTPTTGGGTSLTRLSTSCGAASSSSSAYGSQLSKELVINHSYIPKHHRLPPNPLGIFPRRPINQRYKDLTYYSAFSTSRITSVLTPVLSRIQTGIQTGIHNVVETMSPRKRPPPRPQKPQRSTADISSETDEVPKPTTASVKPTHSPSSTRSGLFFIFLAFASSLLLLYFLYTKAPQLTDEERLLVKYPRSIEDAKGLAKVLSAYKDDHFGHIVLGFFAIYNFLQTFAIPGSIFLSILSGFLFPFPLACFLVSLCSALGASFCYLLSSLVGKPLINRYFSTRVEEWRQHVERQRQNLLSYIIFLRITPFLPNWFINLTSPIIDVPLTHFFVGTFIGVAPPSFVYISAGQTVHTLTSTSSILTWYQIGLLGLVALISLLPVLLKNKLKSKFE